MYTCQYCGNIYADIEIAKKCRVGCEMHNKATQQQSTKNGIKHDAEKPDLSLVSFAALNEVAKVMTYGKQKYAAHNWRLGLKNTRLVASSLRHITAYMMGEDKDPETGLSHISHAICGLMMLMENILLRPSLDDRWKHTEAKDD